MRFRPGERSAVLYGVWAVGPVKTVVGRRSAVIVAGFALTATLSSCSQTGRAEDGPTPPPVTATPTSASVSSASPEERLAAFCASNAAAARAVRGSVADDIIARQAQAEATRALFPIQGASAEVTAGAQSFAAAADEAVGILRQFPLDSMVSDIGTDPRFLESRALTAAKDDPEYRAFLAWTLQSCGLSSTD